MKQHDHNEAMSQLPHKLATLIKSLPQAPYRDHLAAECIKQAERIAELEAERDQHQATATALISLLADIRKACGDNGKRMQPELVEFIGAMSTERDQLRAEVERLRADAERMDWIEACPATQLPKDAEVMRRWLWHRPAGAGNLRAAIDAARTTHKETE